MASTQYRGLTVFISDIRNCKTKEAEQLRVNRELANIRTKFTSKNGINTSYKRKKYVWKMVYMFMLGHEIDFGHMEVIQLITSAKFSEKVVGYMAIATMLRHTDEMMTMVVNGVRGELMSSDPNDFAKCLAMSTVGNLGGVDFAVALSGHVQALLTDVSSSPNVIKNAALCLLRIYRSHAEVLDLTEWLPKVAELMEHRHYGVVISTAALLLGMISNLNGEEHDIGAAHACVVPRCCEILYRLCVMRTVPDEYKYYGTPTPWLQIKLLKILQYFDPPTQPTAVQHLRDVLTKILTKTEVTKSVNKNNADHAVLFEAVNLIIHHDGDVADSMRDKAVGLLGRFISVREPNIRYLGLDTMSRLARIESTTELIKRHQSTILYSLKDADISIRKRALDLLFSMCDETNSSEIVRELLDYLLVADWGIKEEMVLKIAILAERYAPNYQWYVNTILQLITTAGDFVSDDVWHRAMQIISQHAPLQRYSAKRLHQALIVEGAVHQTTIKAAAYVLGEYGFALSQDPEDDAEGGEETLAAVAIADQFDALSAHFEDVDFTTKALLLTSFMKMSNEDSDLQAQVREILDQCRTSIDVELQSRACEYYAMPSLGADAEGRHLMEVALDPMPAFSSDRESVLDRRLQARQEEGADTDVFTAKANTQADSEEEESEEESGEDRAEAEAPAADLMADMLGVGGGGGDMLSVEEDDHSSDEDAPLPQGLDRQMSHSALAGMFDQPAAAPAAVGGSDGLADMFGGGGVSDGGAAAAAALAAQTEAMHRALIISGGGGKILETSEIQVAMQQPQFRLSQGRIQLLFGDKSGGGISELALTCPTLPEMRIAVQGLATSVPARGQIKAMLCVQAMRPFIDPPTLELSYRNASGARVTHAIKAPCMVGSFVTPVPLDGENFKKRWMALTGPREAVAILDVPGGAVDMAKLRSLLVDRLHCAIVEGIDASPYVLSAVGTFQTGTDAAGGKKMTVGTMLRLQANPNLGKVKFTVHSVAAGVSTGMLAAFTSLLG